MFETLDWTFLGVIIWDGSLFWNQNYISFFLFFLFFSLSIGKRSLECSYKNRSLLIGCRTTRQSHSNMSLFEDEYFEILTIIVCLFLNKKPPLRSNSACLSHNQAKPGWETAWKYFFDNSCYKPFLHWERILRKTYCQQDEGNFHFPVHVFENVWWSRKFEVTSWNSDCWMSLQTFMSSFL